MLASFAVVPVISICVWIALVDSAKTFGQNVIPAITGALSGVGSLIESLAPEL